jgi:hypothetical protein
MDRKPIDSRYDVCGIIFLIAILMGISLLPFLFFKISLLGFIGISLLVFSTIGIAVIRRKVSTVKRTNPELFKALEGEDSANATKCALCGVEPAFRFRCYYCKRYFCEAHKLTKNHHCTAAPKVSFRMVLLMSPIMILVGSAILYLAYNSHFPSLIAFAGLLIALGMISPIVRAWEERQSRRTISRVNRT